MGSTFFLVVHECGDRQTDGRICVGDGAWGAGEGVDEARAPLPPISEKSFSGKCHEKIGHFRENII